MSEKLAGAVIILFLAQVYLAIAYYLWSRKARNQRAEIEEQHDGEHDGEHDAEIEERFHRYAGGMPEYPVAENDFDAEHRRWLAPFEGYINGMDEYEQ